jgi:hypothetical protein
VGSPLGWHPPSYATPLNIGKVNDLACFISRTSTLGSARIAADDGVVTMLMGPIYPFRPRGIDAGPRLPGRLAFDSSLSPL